MSAFTVQVIKSEDAWTISSFYKLLVNLVGVQQENHAVTEIILLAEHFQSISGNRQKFQVNF